MKTSKFSDSRTLAILKHAEAGAPVPELCREHGMSSASFYKFLQMAGQIWWYGCIYDGQTERVTSGERPAEKEVYRGAALSRHSQRGYRKKW